MSNDPDSQADESEPDVQQAERQDPPSQPIPDSIVFVQPPPVV